MSYLNLNNEEVIKKYHEVKKKMNISFYSICIAILVIGAVVWGITGYFLLGILAFSFIGLFAFMGHMFYFVVDASELEGLYRHATGKK